MNNPTESGGTEVLTVNIRIGNDAVTNEWDALETLRDTLNRMLDTAPLVSDEDAIAEINGTLTFSRHAMRREWLVRDANGNTVGEIQHVTHDNADSIAWNYGSEVAR